MKRIAPLLPLVLCCGTWIALASRDFSPAVFVSLAAIFATSLALGVAAVSSLGEEKEPADFLHCFLAGSLILALALYFLAAAAPLGIAANFLLLSLAACATAASREVRQTWARLQLSAAGWFALALALAGTTIWSQDNIACLSVFRGRVVLHPWQDLLYHAAQIGLFAHSLGGAELTSPTLHGAPLPLYHYAGYMLSGLLAKLSGADALSLAGGFYAPFGSLLAALAAYAFGALLVGPWAGVLAVAGLLVIPDPSFYRLGTTWTSAAFFQQIAPGGAYAMAAWGLAASHLIRSCGSHHRRLFAASALFAASTIFFKVQIFLVYSYLFALVGLLFFFRWRRDAKILAWAALTSAYALAVAWTQRLPRAPTVRLSASGAAGNLHHIAETFSPPSRFWAGLLGSGGCLRELAAGVPLVTLSTYGLWTVLAPLLFHAAHRRRLLPARILSPLLFFSCMVYINHLIVALALAPNAKYGDPYEVMHKTFVFPYFFIVVAASCLVPLDWVKRRRRPLLAALAALLIFDARAGRDLQSRLWRNAVEVEIPRGLYDAARFVRANAGERDVAQYSRNDRMLMLGSLSERPAYAAYQVVNTPLDDAAFDARFQQVAGMLSLPALDQVRARAAALGIDWLVVDPGDAGAIPFARGARPEFASGGFQVYRLSRS